MDTRTEQVNDLLLEQELLRNERIFEHPTFGTLRLQRPTPRKERMIADARRKQYHKDLRDKSILSQAELEREAIERGMWSTEKRDRIKDLMERIGEMMGLLDMIGYEGVDIVLAEYQQATTRLTVLFEENSKVVAAIVRYFNLDSDPQDADRKLITKSATSTEVDELMEKAQNLRNQIKLLKQLADMRNEHKELMEEYTRLTKDSIEARMDRVEQMAKVYFCVTHMDGTPLWPEFEDMWDSAPQEIEFIMEEMFYFEHGITDEFKKILGKHGFTSRVRATDSSSESSPEHPLPSSSGESPESTLSTS